MQNISANSEPLILDVSNTILTHVYIFFHFFSLNKPSVKILALIQLYVMYTYYIVQIQYADTFLYSFFLIKYPA